MMKTLRKLALVALAVVALSTSMVGCAGETVIHDGPAYSTTTGVIYDPYNFDGYGLYGYPYYDRPYYYRGHRYGHYPYRHHGDGYYNRGGFYNGAHGHYHR